MYDGDFGGREETESDFEERGIVLLRFDEGKELLPSDEGVADQEVPKRGFGTNRQPSEREHPAI